ncbi:MAG: hypothetical protein V4616_09470 [Bacteroidota bacterium]
MKIGVMAVVLLAVLAAACNKEVSVYKDTSNTQVTGNWDLEMAMGKYYLNGQLWKDTIYKAPFKPTDNYRDYVAVEFTRDSALFRNNDGTRKSEKCRILEKVLVFGFVDSVDYYLTNKTLNFARTKTYSDLIGRHRDTITYIFKKISN